jgi:photosystem II stability/assembly factor-like uncharacterized protein
VNGRMTIVRTTDGGANWIAVPPEEVPPALPGDGGFAASGTCLVVEGIGNAWIGTGGAERARVFRSTDRGLTWSAADTPMTAGSSSAGIFSLAFSDGLNGVAVGGDYRREQERSDNLVRTTDGGRTWKLVGSTRLRGFRSGVVIVPGTDGRVLIAVGPAGTDRSSDGGVTWEAIGDAGFDAVSAARSGDAVWASGAEGRIARLALAKRPAAR